ncbi:hypothetical protein IFT84_20375 [Rhizobium sp. CFBP 8762]|uniref:hypothetical protein n=1 Tax=Rhizobium sp. CFBP 8762 TaxID=2775279 RepID=UPI0017877B55|nr:hypothetical protein [Rhizobium sp. CFBP 8762]MBD8556871.1 hypothetical protein [Rhizobium sp. CFBP 8762]
MGLNLEQDIEALFEVKMREFCTWCSKHYALTKAEMMKDNVLDAKPAGYREGWNDALHTLEGALETWIEDQAS